MIRILEVHWDWTDSRSNLISGNCLMNEITLIFAFLQYSLGGKVDMNNVVIDMNWQQLYSFASKQSLLGFCFYGIERLGKEYPEELKQNPIGRELLMTWMGKAQQIRQQNMKVNAVAGKLFAMLREDGFRCCILKGQGNALMYPNPYSRTPGDIDVWVNASREDITEYAKRHLNLEDDIRFHHLETTMDGVPVELHFFPCTMNNPIYNALLQKWFKRNADLQCSNVVSLPDGIGEIAIPTSAFNVIYQLTHLYHHFFDEGIGMRQIIDYYYVVCDFYKVYQKSSKITPTLSPSGEREETALLGARNRYALRMADHQRSRQIVRDGTAWVLLACDLLIMLAIDWVLLACGLLMELAIDWGLFACGLLMNLLLYRCW